MCLNLEQTVLKIIFSTDNSYCCSTFKGYKHCLFCPLCQALMCWIRHGWKQIGFQQVYIIWIVPGHNKQRQQTSFFVMTKRFLQNVFEKSRQIDGSALGSSFASFQTRYLLLCRGNDCNFLWLKSGKVDFLPLSDGKQTCICFTVLLYINGKSQSQIVSSKKMSEGKITSRIEKTFENNFFFRFDYFYTNKKKHFHKNINEIMLK